MSIHGLKAILFDLDDTLYEERQFFQSGFAAVAEFLEPRGIGDARQLAALLEYFHDNGNRQEVFQMLAARLAFPVEWVPEMVAAFRSHQPQICLAPDAREVLPRLRSRYRLGCVTNGRAEVQRRKIQALGVASLMDAVVIADDFGAEFWKPHPRPFLECCARLHVAPEESLFVGDCPEKDTRGARHAGLLSVRLRRPGCCFDACEPAETDAQADADVRNAYELEAWLHQTHNPQVLP